MDPDAERLLALLLIRRRRRRRHRRLYWVQLILTDPTLKQLAFGQSTKISKKVVYNILE